MPSSLPAERYFEDYLPGAVHEFGRVAVSAADIVAFAERFDPQPFHVDPEAARASHFGGVIASGWHTGGLMMRMFAEHYLAPASSLGSPGVDELRWPRPVRPGDVLSLRVTVLDTRRSASRPDRGIVRSLIEVLNQQGEVVMSMRAVNLIACREAAPAG
jgi:acyl dehydratase